MLEGLFGKAGSLNRQKELIKKLNSSSDMYKEVSSGRYSVHDCACVIKTFLKEMIEPLLTKKHCNAHRFIACKLSILF